MTRGFAAVEISQKYTSTLGHFQLKESRQSKLRNWCCSIHSMSYIYGRRRLNDLFINIQYFSPIRNIYTYRKKVGKTSCFCICIKLPKPYRQSNLAFTCKIRSVTQTFLHERERIKRQVNQSIKSQIYKYYFHQQYNMYCTCSSRRVQKEISTIATSTFEVTHPYRSLQTLKWKTGIDCRPIAGRYPEPSVANKRLWIYIYAFNINAFASKHVRPYPVVSSNTFGYHGLHSIIIFTGKIGECSCVGVWKCNIWWRFLY